MHTAEVRLKPDTTYGTRFKAQLALTLLLLAPTIAQAQQRPLVTEDPETIGAGRVLLEAGVGHDIGVLFPVSGLEGDVTHLPTFGISIGLSSIAELQFDAGFNRMGIDSRRAAPLSDLVTADGDSTSDAEDVVVATKVRVLSEGVTRPAFGARFATRLPNASNESGLGLDTTDFFASLLMAKTIESVRVVTNLGVGILSDPTRGDRQNDLLTYGFSLARAVTNAAEVVGEWNGRAHLRDGDPPPGTESRSAVRVGTRYTVGGWRGDAALVFGLTSRDPNVGFAAGFTYVFNAFQVP